VPVVSSRFNDRKPLARRTADVLERALISDFDADDLHATLIQVRDDLELNSRGTVWVGLKDRDGLQVPCAYHIDRKDYRHSPARKEQEISWKGRRSWNTKAEIKERFKRVPDNLTFQQQNIGGKFEGEKKAAIWEIWDKPTQKVVWVSEGCPELLDERKPWYNLNGFFPTVTAYGTLKRSTLIPVPDFVYYSDQIAEINELTCRIAALADGLKIRGLYNAGSAELAEEFGQLLNKMDDGVMLMPVPSLGNMAIKDIIMFLPLAEISNAIQVCVELRRVIIDDVYSISGISDIMRGETEASETLGAQQLKSQYGSARIKAKQTEMQRVAREITRMKGEMLAESVEINDLLTMAQVDDLPTEQELMEKIAPQVQQIVQQAEAGMMQALQAGDHQQGQQIQKQAQEALDQLKSEVTVEKVSQLLQDQKNRPFVLDIETDSTVEPDQQAEKQQRVEFAGAMGPLLQQGLQAMNLAGPQAGAVGKFFAESLRYMASGFRSDRRMDEAIDELSEQLAQFQPPPQGEDPGVAQAKVEVETVKAEAAKAKGQSEMQLGALKVQVEQMKAQGQQGDVEKTSAETDKIRAEIMKIMQEIKLAPAELQLEAQGQQMDAQQGVMKMRMDAEGQQQENARQDKQMAFDQQRAVGEDKRADKQLAVSSKTEAAKAKALSRPPSGATR
jgi:hypothetical protein